MSEVRYLKITQTDGVRYILRVTRETPDLVVGIEVDAEGDEVVPRGVHPKIGAPYHQRERRVMRGAIKKAVEMRMNPTYASLEAVPRGASAGAQKKSAARLDAEIAEVLAVPKPPPSVRTDRQLQNWYWRKAKAARSRATAIALKSGVDSRAYRDADAVADRLEDEWEWYSAMLKTDEE